MIQVIKSHVKDFGFALFIIVGLAGMVVHWAKKWLKDETNSSLFAYLFVNNAKYTATSVFTYFGAVAALIAAGTVDFTATQSLALSFTAGYMIDSAINKDEV